MRLRLSRMRFGASGCTGVCAVGPEDKTHPNKTPFTGTLLILDEASNKPPHGAEGHRIFVPSAVAKKRLGTLINTGINYTRELDSHSPRHKVGVITGARISGNKVLVNGFLWGKDFPEVSRDLRAGKLGMSMELADVYVRSKTDPIWHLEDFHFSGATILFKSAAAYTNTALSVAASAGKKVREELALVVKAAIAQHFKKTALAAAAAKGRIPNEGGHMAKKKTVHASGDGSQGDLLVKAISAGVAPAIETSMRAAFKPLADAIGQQNTLLKGMVQSLEEVRSLSIEAAKDAEDDEEEINAAGHEEEDDDMDAARHHEEEEDDDMEAKGKKSEEDDEDEGDEEDDAELDAEIEHLEDDPAEEEPGEINEDAENKGDKTTRSGKIGKAKKMGVKASSLQASSVIRELYASHRALRKKYRTLQAKSTSKIEAMANKLEALEAQVETYANREERRSVSAELSNFLAKNDVNVGELRAEGRKLSVAEVDAIFANSPVAHDPTTRMWFKNQMLEAGVMEQGEIHRGA